MKVLMPLVLLTFCPALMPAQVTGTWLGTLKYPEQTVRLVFHISEQGKSLRATADSPDQNIWGAQVDSITLSGNVLTIETPSWNDGRFVGDVTPEGIVGFFSQHGNSFPLVLTRSAGVPRTPPDTTSSVTNGRYYNDWTGIAFSLPPGFTVVQTETESNAGGMQVDLAVPDLKNGRVAVFMNLRRMRPEGIAADLARQIPAKINRRGGATVGYTIPENGIQILAIGGQQAILATAYYSSQIRTKKIPMVEMLAWISTEHTFAHFYAIMPADQLDLLRPSFEQMVMSAQVP